MSKVKFGIPICPITQEAIIDPVIDPEGNTFERAAIIQWLVDNKTSPITRNHLEIDDLVTNRAILEIIELIKKTNIKDNPQNNRNTNGLSKCSKCSKEIKVSANYKGKQEPMCFKCRPWNCKACTYSNNSQAKKCEMCETMRD